MAKFDDFVIENGTLVMYTGKNADVVIPEHVKSIGDCAFSGCNSLKSVVIPQSVTNIGNSAFSHCDNLSKVVISNSVIHIESYAFEYCDKLMNVYYTGSLQKWAKISIDYGNGALKKAFRHFDYVASVNGKTDAALPMVSSGIADFEIVDGVLKKYTGNGTNVVIPNSVTSISSFAFSGCNSLTSVVISDSVYSIGGSAFNGCSSLTSVVIGSSVTSIDSQIFYQSNVKTVYYNSTYCASGNQFLGTVDKIVFNGSYVPYYFASYTGFNGTTVEMGDNVGYISSYAFENCGNLKNVTIGNSVNSIGDYAFYKCSSLASVVIPDSVTSIGDYAFRSCSSLTSVVIPDSVKSIGRSAFYGCYKLVEVINHSSLNITAGSKDYGYVGYYAKEVHSGTSKIVNKDGYIFYIYDGTNYLVNYIGNDTDLVLPANYNGQNYEINQFAFNKNNKITSIVIPDSVTSIGDVAFYECSSLTSVVIPDSVTSIGDYAFNGCSSLARAVVIPNSVKNIGCKAFYGCSSLTSVVIPDSVTSIGEYAFKGCTRLTEVYHMGSIEKWLRVTLGRGNELLQKIVKHSGNDAPASKNEDAALPEAVPDAGDQTLNNCTSLTDDVTGSSDEWQQLPIGEDNDDLKNAAAHCDLESDVVEDGTAIEPETEETEKAGCSKNNKAYADAAIAADPSKHILIHDKFLEQMKNDKQYFEHIFKELLQLSFANSYDSISEYLKNHNGKKMAGSGTNIWKFQISKGDRLLYTYGKYINGIRKGYEDAIVLIGYSKHDDQGRDARNFGFSETEINELNAYISENTETNIQEVEDSITAPVAQMNYLDRHKLFYLDEESLVSVKLDDSDVYLSNEQSKCVDAFVFDPSPTLVLGGAGTGKTLIALHVINDFSTVNEQRKAVYFTQSYELRKSAEKRFGIISQMTDNNVLFKDINEFSLELLNRPLSDMAAVVTQNRFVNEFPDWMSKNYRGKLKNPQSKTDWVSAWTEIRGIIKGQLGSEWNRFSPILRSDAGNKFEVEYLIEKRWVKVSESDGRYLIPCTNVSDMQRRLDSETIEAQYVPLIKKIIYRFSGVDPECVDMGKETYCGLSEENSTVPLSKRESYWEIYSCYKCWLEENDYFDENDLARWALKAIKTSQNDSQYDLVVADEIQDYTEVQIYLLHSLSKDKVNILLVGDGNQNVNPTLFRAEHLSALYANESKKLKTFCLHRDYRCPGRVVNLSNKLAKIRSEKIAKQHEEQEVELESVLEEGSVPYRLAQNDENIISLISEMAEHPSAIILVPDTNSKDRICKIAEKANVRDLPVIHTIPEIKGMEYKYVLCYDIIGKYCKQWESIMSSDHVRKLTGERYFFNLLYVGMTRSQMYLGFMDSCIPQKLEDELSLRQEEKFDAVQLHFTEMQSRPEDWLSTAEAYEKVGNYDDAIRMYMKVNSPLFVIHRCESQKFMAEHLYDDAFRYALLSENEDLLNDVVSHMSAKSDLYPLAMAVCNVNECRFKPVKATETMNEYLRNSFSAFESGEKEKIEKIAVESIRHSTDNQIHKIKEFFSNER